MTRPLVIIFIALFFAGCATTEKENPPAPPPPVPQARKAKPVQKKRERAQLDRATASKRLVRAVELLQEGDTAGAIRGLSTIVAAKGVPGVTDEAMFRLALLTLRPSPEGAVSKRGRHLLRRLREEYPTSSWTLQAVPLLELIAVEDELRQQNRTLRSTNQSLTRKISELNDSIEQLKHLDLELEQKNK